MKLKGSLKNKMLSLFFLLISAGLVAFIYFDAGKTRQTIKVPVLNKTIEYGQQISGEDITLKEISAYKLDLDIVKEKSKLENQFALKTLEPNRLIYKEDVSLSKPPVDVIDQIKYGAVSIPTDLAKCVGGIPKAGDWVKAKIIKIKDDNREEREIIQHEELLHIQIIDIQNSSGISTEKEKEEDRGAFSNTSNIKPSLVTFDATPAQEEKLLEGAYEGEIHLVLLPREFQKEDVNLKEIWNLSSKEDLIEGIKKGTESGSISSLTLNDTNENVKEQNGSSPEGTENIEEGENENGSQQQ